jgi:peptidoglycan L-alanyl-D-glutamate endopeptidase CwlK
MSTFKGSEYINKLHPSIRQKAAELAQAFNDAGIPIFINHDGHYRTFAEQDALYTKKVKNKKGVWVRVTNAKGGHSNHNYGLAVDMVPVDGAWNAPDSVYKEMGKIAKSLGWEWGGDFKSIYDPCHFQMFFGYTISKLLKKHQNGEVDSNGYVILT